MSRAKDATSLALVNKSLLELEALAGVYEVTGASDDWDSVWVGITSLRMYVSSRIDKVKTGGLKDAG